MYAEVDRIKKEARTWAVIVSVYGGILVIEKVSLK